MEETQIIETKSSLSSVETVPVGGIVKESSSNNKQDDVVSSKSQQPASTNYCLKLIEHVNECKSNLVIKCKLFPLISGVNRIGRTNASNICILDKVCNLRFKQKNQKITWNILFLNVFRNNNNYNNNTNQHNRVSLKIMQSLS